MGQALTTTEWAKSFGISVAPNAPSIPDYTDLPVRSANDIAVRSVILQGLAAVAAGVEAEPITDWFGEQGIGAEISPDEQAFLAETRPSDERRTNFQWHMEAEWTLLWTIGRVESLGLPTQSCDSRRFVDEIIPALGSNIGEFVDGASLRSAGELLAEDDRTYDLWCRYNLATSNQETVPDDLNYWVLYERRYAFEWLDGNQEWDDVTCDA